MTFLSMRTAHTTLKALSKMQSPLRTPSVHMHMSMCQDGLYNRKNMYMCMHMCMLQRGSDRCAQNFTAELPYTIAAFVFNLNGQNAAQYGGEDEVTERYVKFLDRNCLTESDIPASQGQSVGGRRVRLATQYRSMSLIFLATPFRWRPLSFQKDFH